MANIIPIKGREVPKSEQSRMETVILSIADVGTWKVPPFQRPLRVNDKVRASSEKMKQTETIEGVVTLGKLPKDPTLWVVDGQHRREAFMMSGIAMVMVDLRIMNFDTTIACAAEHRHRWSACRSPSVAGRARRGKRRHQIPSASQRRSWRKVWTPRNRRI